MALNDIIFVKNQGGLGRPLAGEDYISGLAIFTDNLPSGFNSSDRIKLIGSVQDAENLGITNDYADATNASGTISIVSAGSPGDYLLLQYAQPGGSLLTLANYSVTAADNTPDLQAIAVANAINAGTYTHGFTASASGGVITIVVPKSQGLWYSTNPFVVYVSGDFTTTTNQPSGGTASELAVWHYHIAEYFRIQPKGSLYVGFFATSDIGTFAGLQTMQIYAGGKIRQVGVFANSEFNAGHLTAIQAIANILDTEHMPISSAIYAGDIYGLSDLTTLSDLNSYNAPKTSAVISQDGAGQGAFLYLTCQKSITTLGATLGAVSLALVSEDIAWPVKFNISNGTECDTIAFANGTLASAVSKSNQETLDNRRYIFLVKYVGLAGSFFNDSHTAVAVNSDYAYIENNRTIDKAIRNVYAALIAYINSPLVLNTDGTLKDTTIAFFESLANTSLDEMVRASELSGKTVLIDPTQNVLATSNITITVKLLPVGVARQITVNIGFTTTL